MELFQRVHVFVSVAECYRSDEYVDNCSWRLRFVRQICCCLLLFVVVVVVVVVFLVFLKKKSKKKKKVFEGWKLPESNIV